MNQRLWRSVVSKGRRCCIFRCTAIASLDALAAGATCTSAVSWPADQVQMKRACRLEQFVDKPS
jgi:hypothetical protein